MAAVLYRKKKHITLNNLRLNIMSEVARYFTNLEIVTVLRPEELKCNHIKVCNRSTFLLSISPYSDRMRENTDQNNSEYGHFLRSYFYFVSFFIFSITYKKIA